MQKKKLKNPNADDDNSTGWLCVRVLGIRQAGAVERMREMDQKQRKRKQRTDSSSSEGIKNVYDDDEEAANHKQQQ